MRNDDMQRFALKIRQNSPNAVNIIDFLDFDDASEKNLTRPALRKPEQI